VEEPGVSPRRAKERKESAGEQRQRCLGAVFFGEEGLGAAEQRLHRGAPRRGASGEGFPHKGRREGRGAEAQGEVAARLRGERGRPVLGRIDLIGEGRGLVRGEVDQAPDLTVGEDSPKNPGGGERLPEERRRARASSGGEV